MSLAPADSNLHLLFRKILLGARSGEETNQHSNWASGRATLLRAMQVTIKKMRLCRRSRIHRLQLKSVVWPDRRLYSQLGLLQAINHRFHHRTSHFRKNKRSRRSERVTGPPLLVEVRKMSAQKVRHQSLQTWIVGRNLKMLIKIRIILPIILRKLSQKRIKKVLILKKEALPKLMVSRVYQ